MMGGSSGWGRGLLALALLVAVFTLMLGSPARADRFLSAEVALAGGWSDGATIGGESFATSQSLVGFCTVRCMPAALAGQRGAALELRVRHPIYDDASHYWRGKREFVVELTAPLARARLTGFVTWTKAYSGRSSGFGLAGVRKSF